MLACGSIVDLSSDELKAHDLGGAHASRPRSHDLLPIARHGDSLHLSSNTAVYPHQLPALGLAAESADLGAFRVSPLESLVMMTATTITTSNFDVELVRLVNKPASGLRFMREFYGSRSSTCLCVMCGNWWWW